MRCSHCILLLVLTGWSFLVSVGQDYSFKFFTAADGLSDSEILSLQKDHNGYLWIGTMSGLSRFDGYQFLNYEYSSDNFQIGTVNCMVEDSSHRLWIGAGSGLYCYSGDKLVKLSEGESGPQGVNSILLGENDSMYLATEIGPVAISRNLASRFGEKKIRFSQYLLPGWVGPETMIDRRRAVDIKIAGDGTLFIMSFYRIFRYLGSTFETIYTDPHNDRILGLFPMSGNKIFFELARYGFQKWEKGTVTGIDFTRRYTPGKKMKGPGFWYLGTLGIFRFHPEEECFGDFIDIYDKDILWPSSFLPYGKLYWLATHNGLVRITPSPFKNYKVGNRFTVHDFFSFLQRNNGDLIVGANRGLLVHVASNDTLTNFLGERKSVVPLAEVKALLEDRKGRIWAGTGYQGLGLIDNGNIRVFTEKDGLQDNSIHALLELNTGQLLAVGDHGCSEIREEGDHFLIKSYYVPSHRTQHADFYGAIQTSDDQIWIGGTEGIYRMEAGKLVPYAFGNRQISVTDMKTDREGHVWISTEGDGVYECRYENRALIVHRRFTMAEGLSTNLFKNILVDDQDNIWLGSPNGISYISKTENGRAYNWDEHDGFLPAGYNNIKLFQDRNGKIWVATTQGFVSFVPEHLFRDIDQPKMQIRSLRALNDLNNDSLLSRSNNKNGIKLRHQDNSIQIGFSAIDFPNQEGMAYYYRLLGLDTNWILGGANRQAVFQHLKRGRYVFEVKALNKKGIWSDPQTLSFSIKPPLWQQTWFLLLTGMALAALIYSLYHQRVLQIKQREAQKTELEKLRAVSFQYQLEIEQIVNYFARSINAQQSIDDMLWDLARNCISRLGFEDCVIYLKNESGDYLIQKAAWGPKTSEDNMILAPLQVPLGKGIVGTVAVSGQAEIINDTSADARYIADDANRLSEIAVPILNQGKVLGVIDSEHPGKNFYTQTHLQILNTVASLCGEKIEKMKAEQESRNREIQVLQLSSDLASSQLTALRAQMNPHFIFNALNSVQQFILKGDAEEANRYLSKFSKLQREILQNSDQSFISLEKETEILHIYLQLEQLRFDDGFRYEISISPELDPDEVMIPPMIIQPFAENAIWHGLMPKQGDKTLSILFSPKGEDQLECIITDNGIGRDASADLKNKNQGLPRHPSRGLSLVYKRLQVLEKQLQQAFAVSIQDLVAPDGSPKGTRVVVTLFTGL